MRRLAFIVFASLLFACSRPASDESYRLIDGDSVSFTLDMADSLRYSLELLIYAGESAVGDDAVLPVEVSLLSPDNLVYRDRLDFHFTDIVENNPSSSVFAKVISEGFRPVSYGEWSMTVRFIPEDIEKLALRGVGVRLERE